MQRRLLISEGSPHQVLEGVLGACFTAGSTLAVVIDPPDTGAGGRWLSPKAGWIRFTGMPMTSETTWVMGV
jgi:hypothetical protein